MLWMKTFCFSCSVRLGVICSAILSIIQVVIPLMAFFIIGTPIFTQVTCTLESDVEYRQHYYIRKILDLSKNEPEKFILIIELYLSFHIVSCICAIIGAYRFNKWLLIPYTIMEFNRFIITLSTHIIAMIILKKTINLGLLIAATIIGGFFILSIGYMWTGCVALFQIIRFVNTDKYKHLYGNDPLSPIDNETDYNNMPIENVKIFSTPNYDEVDAQKMENYSLTSVGGSKKLIKNNSMKKIFPKVSTISDERNEQNFNSNDIEYGQYWHINELITMNSVMKRWNNNNYNQNNISYY